MNKKAITILGAIFLLIVGTLGFLIYQRSGKSDEPKQTQGDGSDDGSNQGENPPPPDDTGNTGENPPPDDIGENPPPDDGTSPVGTNAVKLLDGEIISPVLFYQGNGITYLNSSGQLFQVDIQASSGRVELVNKRELTIPLKSGIKKILWPQAGNNFIAQQETGGKKVWSVYDSGKGVYVDLPSQITALNWMPGGDKILYLWLDKQGQTTLNVANYDNTGYQTIVDIWENDDDIALAPDGRNILFWRTQNQDAKNKINLVSPDGKLFKAVVSEGYNIGLQWSPDSKKFLFARKDPTTQKYQLWVGNILSGEIRNLNVYATPEKAAWSSDSQIVYVSAAKDLSSSGELSQDIIYKINLSSNDRSEFEPGVAIDGRDLFLNLSGDALFFKNAQDGGLYYMPLNGSSGNSSSNNGL